MCLAGGGGKAINAAGSEGGKNKFHPKRKPIPPWSGGGKRLHSGKMGWPFQTPLIIWKEPAPQSFYPPVGKGWPISLGLVKEERGIIVCYGGKRGVSFP